MDVSKLVELPTELLDIWHAHRALLIVGAGMLLAVLRLILYSRRGRRKIPLTPPAGEAIHDNKADLISEKPIKQVLLDEEHFDAVLPSQNATLATKLGPKRIVGNKRRKGLSSSDHDAETHRVQPVVFYFTIGGSTKVYAEQVAQFIQEHATDAGPILTPIIHDLTQIEYDDFFITPPKSPSKDTAQFYTLLIPSYDIDTELTNFLSHMQETHHDFRIDTASLSQLAGYTVFGMGDKEGWATERDGFCSQAVEVDKWMARLTGRKRAFPLGMGDVKSDVDVKLREWTDGFTSVLGDLAVGKGLGEGVPGSGDAEESGDEDEVDDETETGLSPTTMQRSSKRAVGSDLEDIKAPIPVDFTTKSTNARQPLEPKPMVPKTSPTYTSLTKQGYTIVGSHSGVKICRWTKSAMRGRGSCYKFSFYGIASHLCMEATPSLSCSNKCVFCWRHGTNPVGTTWRWTVDPPDAIFKGMKEGHYQKIKMMRGVPGVRAERFAEAMRIRHCALSLVGEPIFYPHINELLAMLHREHISSFLVCNAQHPDQLAALGPVTQLYVSIDASNKDSLRRIDRPLHRDFWERFIRCMDILREKRNTHRTVFRLTLVKGFNVEDEAEGYADLVARAEPGFVEVKGVTYCGTSTSAGAGLSMQNVPFYEEVTAFVLALEAALAKRGLDYGIAAEHAHSCCVLLADRTRFFRPSKDDGVERWHTLIDYPKFFACVESGQAFGPEDYIGAPTAEWALWGNGGFDPRDVKVDKKGKPKVIAEQ